MERFRFSRIHHCNHTESILMSSQARFIQSSVLWESSVRKNMLFNLDFPYPHECTHRFHDFCTMITLTSEIIDLDNNFLTGSLPDEMYNMKNLRRLRVANNDISGTLSTLIGQLDSLTHLDLSSNGVNGTIPKEIDNLTAPDEIILRDNDFSGTIPRIGNAQNLSKLEIISSYVLLANRKLIEYPSMLDSCVVQVFFGRTTTPALRVKFQRNFVNLHTIII